jgi:ribosome-binding factor A
MFTRNQRVQDLIREEISAIVFQEVKDPRVGFVTVSHVEVTEDLRVAKVYFALHGSDRERRDSMAGLHRAQKFIRRKLGEKIRLKHLPELIFREDLSVDHVDRISKILNKLKKEEEPGQHEETAG